MKILILISGGAQIRRHICIVDLYRWLNENNKNRNNKAIVLSDMLSDSIEYKNRRSAQLICDPKSIPIFFHNQPAPRNIQYFLCYSTHSF